jgi:Rab-GTPase-TBC domain
MHAQLVALRRVMQLLDPQLHAFLEAKDCLNYFFCYRWLLIHFKREFGFDEVRACLGMAEGPASGPPSTRVSQAD